jgi:hypothetical protein
LFGLVADPDRQKDIGNTREKRVDILLIIKHCGRNGGRLERLRAVTTPSRVSKARPRLLLFLMTRDVTDLILVPCNAKNYDQHRNANVRWARCIGTVRRQDIKTTDGEEFQSGAGVRSKSL